MKPRSDRPFDIDLMPSAFGGLPSGFAAGRAHISQQLDFRESRHSLHHVDVPGEEELKNELGRLAHAAIMAMTLGTSVPLATVDDWIDWLEHERHRYNGDIGKLLISLRDYLSARSVNELGLGNLAKAEQLSRLGTQFGELLARFNKAVASTAPVAPVEESSSAPSHRSYAARIEVRASATAGCSASPMARTRSVRADSPSCRR